MVFSCLVLAVLSTVSAWESGTSYRHANAWNSRDSFPEQNDGNLMSRPNTGIAFSGGGSRSYLAATGYLAGLTELGLMDKVRYISGISGGSWATVSYMYAQTNVDDSILLGPVVEPADLTEENLKIMDSNCMRGVTDAEYVGIMLQYMKDGIDAGEAWMKAYQDVYLAPLGIPQNQPFTWSQESIDRIREANPSLMHTDFVLPTNSHRPYSIVGASNLGPAAGAPYEVGDNLNLTMLEMTPLYIGSMNTKEVHYKYHHGLSHTKTMGGVVEPFAYALYDNNAVPQRGLGDDEMSTLKIPDFEKSLDLAHMGGSSSYAIGMFMDSLPEKLRTNLDYSMQYWSPVDNRPSSDETLFADGGCFENILVSSMLQRRVEKLVLFFNAGTPLQPTSSWDVFNDVYTGEEVTDSLAALFGIFPSDETIWQERGYDYRNNQQWSTDDWYTLITKMQEAQGKGGGIVVSMNLTTIGNDVWNIPAGITSEVTFVYLGRSLTWEGELNSDLYSLLVPSDPIAASDPSQTIDNGHYKHFPHYATAAGSISYDKANALADLTGWTIKHNAELFVSILS